MKSKRVCVLSKYGSVTNYKDETVQKTQVKKYILILLDCINLSLKMESSIAGLGKLQDD